MFELGNKNFAFSSKYGNIGKFYSVYKRVIANAATDVQKMNAYERKTEN